MFIKFKKALSVFLLIAMLFVSMIPNVMASTNIVSASTESRFAATIKLSSKMNEAKNQVGAGNNFTIESRQRVWDAIDRADELLRDGTSTVEELLAQIEVLQQAIDALEVPDINTDELWKVIERADAFIEREGKYPEVDYTEFQEVISNAKVAYYYGQSQEQVDSAKEALEIALNNLEKIYQDIKDRNASTSAEPTETAQPTSVANEPTTESSETTTDAPETTEPTSSEVVTDHTETTQPTSIATEPTTESSETITDESEPTSSEVVTDPTETAQPTSEVTEPTAESIETTTDALETTEPTTGEAVTNPTETAQPTTDLEEPITEPTESTTESTGSTTESVQPTTSSTEPTESTTDSKPKAKKANKMKITVKTKTVKAKKLKKAKVTVKAITVKNNNGAVSYKKVAKKSSKRLTINTKTGKITVKKGTKKNTYKIKVKITAKGTKNYKPKTVTKTVKIKVK